MPVAILIADRLTPNPPSLIEQRGRSPAASAVSLDLAKQLGVSIKVATGPHERLSGLHDDSVFAMSPFLQFTDEINANQ